YMLIHTKYLLSPYILLVTKKRRQSPYASRFTTNHHQIWDVCAHMGAVPILMICSFTCGGDCEAIEQYVLDIGFPNPNTKV
ncbi:hypothetical protein, partial [Prevotella sp. HMSC077E09]